jgi:hypothetical protein
LAAREGPGPNTRGLAAAQLARQGGLASIPWLAIGEGPKPDTGGLGGYQPTRVIGQGGLLPSLLGEGHQGGAWYGGFATAVFRLSLKGQSTSIDLGAILAMALVGPCQRH